MATIKLEDVNATTFRITRVHTGTVDSYPKGNYRTVTQGNDVGLAEATTNIVHGAVRIVAPTVFSEWVDDGDTPYASLAALQAAINSICF